MAEGSSRERLSRCWEFRWDDPRGNPRDEDGKRYSRNSRVTAFHGTKSEAEAKLSEIEANLQDTG